MNRSYLTHGLWAAAAATAFLIGSKSGSQEEGAHGEGREVVFDSRDGGRLSALPEAGGEKGAAAVSTDVMAGAGAMDVKLTTARIDELAAAALKDPNPLNRRAAFDELLKGLNVENALEMREHIKGFSQNSSEFRDFHYAWGAIAGDTAVAHGMDSKERDMEVTLAGWAGSDSAGALAWFKSLSDEEGAKNPELRAGIVHGLADTDTTAAANFVYELNPEDKRQANGLMNIVTGEMLRTVGPEEASRWTESLPEGELRVAAMDRVANQYVAEDPEAAAAWASGLAKNPENARVIEEVGDEWAERDPVAAVGWLESLEGGEGKEQGLRSAFGEWVKRDPLAASERLVEMSDSPERDSAISGFVRRLAYEDPQSAIAWAGEISDPAARQQTLVRAGQAMLRKDAEGTKDWLRTSGLSAEAQQEVLNSRRRR